jgi:predicted kinase
MHGFSGSGKTWLSSKLVSELPAIRVRSDIERKRMLDLDEHADSNSGIGKGNYAEAVNKDTYERLHDIAEIALRAGHNIIIDASYLKNAERARARDLAARCDSSIILIETTVSAEIQHERIHSRQRAATDASEAGPDVADYQRRNAEHLTTAERDSAIRIDTGIEVDLVNLAQKIRRASSR